MSSYISMELFHFVGHAHPFGAEENFSTLLQILTSGHVTHAPHIPGGGSISFVWNPAGKLISEKLIVPTVTCYADIPFQALSLHTAKYGNFGVGIDRSHLVRYGARPAIYWPVWSGDDPSIHGSGLLNDLEAIYLSFQSHYRDELKEPRAPRSLGKPVPTKSASAAAIASSYGKDFLAFIKPFDAELPLDDPRNFYSEREWRMYGNLAFAPSNVTRVLVQSGFKRRLEEEFPVYADRINEMPAL